jgi:hypothetical protein
MLELPHVVVHRFIVVLAKQGSPAQRAVLVRMSSPPSVSFCNTPIRRYQPLHGRDQDGDGKDGDLCRLQMQQWLRGNLSYSSMQGDSIPHDIGFRGSKSMMRVSAMSDSSEKLVVCVRLTKAHAQVLKESPGGIDTFLEVRKLFTR